MAVQNEPETIPAEVDPDPDAGAPRKAMTIGAVCKALEQEFPDISISKIRYLEDQKLLAPVARRGGYRLYSGGDVQRLRRSCACSATSSCRARHPPGARLGARGRG